MLNMHKWRKSFRDLSNKNYKIAVPDVVDHNKVAVINDARIHW